MNVPKWLFAVFALMLLVGCGIDASEIESRDATIAELEEGNANILANVETLTAKIGGLEASIASKQGEIDALNAKLIAKPIEPVIVVEDKETAAATLDDYDTTDGLVLGDFINEIKLDNNDLDFLIDSTIKFDNEDYDVSEEIVLKNSIGVLTSLNGDEEFDDSPVLVFDSADNIEYQYIFDKADLDFTEIDEDDALEIVMLGKLFTIVDFDGSEFTIIEGTDFPLKESDKMTFEGKVIVLDIVGQNEAYITVDGIGQIIEEGDSEDFGDLNIRVTSLMYTGKDSVKSMATLTVGNDVEQTIKNGDEFIEDNEYFEWVIETNGNFIEYIGIRHVDRANDIDDKILRPREVLDFAGLFDVEFDFGENYKYIDFDISFDEITSADIKVVVFESDGENLVLGNEELEKAYFDGTLVWYKDNNNDWINSTETLILVNDETEYEVSMNGTILEVGQLELDLQGGFTHFGATDEEAEATDLIVNGVELGKQDYNVLLEDGAIIENPENDLDNDELAISLPNEEVEMLIKVGR